MRAILIDPINRIITEVQYSGVYTNIYDHIEAQYFDIVRISVDEDLYVDDEGLLKPNKYFYVSTYSPNQPLAGKGLVLGRKGEDAVATKLTVEQVQRMVSFL